MEMLKRCLFLHRFANVHEHIALHSTPEDVISKAVEVVMAMEHDEEFLELIGLSIDTIVDHDSLKMSWPRLYCKFVAKDESRIDEIMELHLNMSTRMAAHLKGVFEGIQRTSWLLMSLLSTNVLKAQEAARRLKDHLIRLPQGGGNYFEEYFKSQDVLMTDLDNFAASAVPTLLWRNHGTYSNLYISFLPHGASQTVVLLFLLKRSMADGSVWRSIVRI